MGPAERLIDLLHRQEDSVPLDEAVSLVAAALRSATGGPELDVAFPLAALDELAERCTDPTAAGLVHHLYRVEGFAGDAARYSDPRNSYLDQVLERRRGIPITLAVVVLEVGRRLGLSLSAVGMPGHFLVRVGAGPGRDFLDPFGGALIGEDGALALFRAVHGADAPFRPSFLDPVGPHAIVARILANLRRDLAGAGEWTGALEAARLRVMVPGVPRTELADVARLEARLGRYRSAAATLEGMAGELPESMAARARRDAHLLRSRLN